MARATGTRAIPIEIIAALMHQSPRTLKDLHEYVGSDDGSVRTWLRVLQGRGLVHKAGRVPKEYDANGGLPTGPAPVLWALQPKPFALPDTE